MVAGTSGPGGTHFPVASLGGLGVCLMTLCGVEESGGAGLLTVSANVS